MTESHKTQERMPVFQRIVNRPELIERISGIRSESVSQVLIKEEIFTSGSVCQCCYCDCRGDHEENRGPNSTLKLRSTGVSHNV